MRILASTFKQGDLQKILEAMRSFSYDKLVLIGDPKEESCEDLRKIQRLEEMAGHEVDFSATDEDDFMGIVAKIAQELAEKVGGRRRPGGDTVILNISGGSKLLGDAALLAAFVLGVEAYHVNGKVTRLPVIRDATVRDRLTKSQALMLESVGDRTVSLDSLVKKMGPMSRQATDRVIRDLRKEGFIRSRAEGGEILIWLSDPGREILRALRLAQAG